MPLDFSECPAIRTNRSHHLLFFSQVRHLPEPVALTLLPGTDQGISRLVALPTGHQFPGDPGELVGKGNGNQLRRLPFKKTLEPRPVPFPAAPHLTDHSCRSNNENAAQGLVTGFRDRPQAVLSAG